MKLRVVCLVLLAANLIIPFSLSSAQDRQSIFDEIKRDHEWIEKNLHKRTRTSQLFSANEVAAVTPSQSVDVKHYRLQIRLDLATSAIAGTVTIEGETLAPTSGINIDAEDSLQIDGVRLDGAALNFRHKQDKIALDLAQPLAAGRRFAIAIDYHGTGTGNNGLGEGMLVDRHGPVNTPVMATLSEPFGAPSWWPCIDDARDKATAEVEITVPAGYQATSNGRLVKTESNADQTTTFFWREDFPLSTYLVAVSATNYVKFEDTYTALDGTTMPLTYYVYPHHLEIAQQKFAVTRRAMEIFAPLFGEYPFLNEKYGMVEFPWGGGMEHQTLTSLGSSVIGSSGTSQSIIAHELAHQWWGDLVTLRTWDDIWLNEGFASYSEVLFFERFSNINAGDLMRGSYDDGKMSGRLGGTVTAEDLDNPFDDTGAVYTKGAWVLHMLRHLLGDQAFFDALKDYRQRFAYSNASTSDFQQVCEDHYGAKLDWFFTQWVYATGRPAYKVSTDTHASDTGTGFTLKVTIKQKQTQSIPGRSQSVYIMPLDVTIKYAGGQTEKHVVMNDARKQTFTFNLAKQPVDVSVDENNWVLKKLK